MSINLTIEAPDFERIARGSGEATASAIRLLWAIANQDRRSHRLALREAIDRWQKKTFVTGVTTSQNDFAYDTAAIVRFTGASALNVTGLRAGVEGEVVFVFVIGTGTITLKHDSASSEAANRFVLSGGADVGITTNRGMMLLYQNSRWREFRPM